MDPNICYWSKQPKGPLIPLSIALKDIEEAIPLSLFIDQKSADEYFDKC